MQDLINCKIKLKVLNWEN